MKIRKGKISRLLALVMSAAVVVTGAMFSPAGTMKAEATTITGTVNAIELEVGDIIGPGASIGVGWDDVHSIARGDMLMNGGTSLIEVIRGGEVGYISFTDLSAYAPGFSGYKVTGKAELDVTIVGIGGSGNSGSSNNNSSTTTTTSYVPACSHEYEWVVENDPTYDTTGLRVNKCKKCGNICESQIIPATKDDFGASQEYYANKIKQAKAGQTIIIDFGNWNTITKAFFEELSKKRDITTVIRFRYKNQNYEFTIDKNQTIDTSLPYYGPEKLIQLYNAHVRGK